MSDYINENLLGASPYKNQQAESKKLVAKWEKTGLLDGLNEDFKKSAMAVMLENQAKQLISEATTTGGGYGSTSGGQAGSEECLAWLFHWFVESLVRLQLKTL